VRSGRGSSRQTMLESGMVEPVTFESAAAAWDWGKAVWASEMSLLMRMRIAVSHAAARSRERVAEGSAARVAASASGSHATTSWIGREEPSSPDTSSMDAAARRDRAGSAVGVSIKSWRRSILVRRFGDNGEEAMRGIEGARDGRRVDDEAMARAFAKLMLVAWDDGGGTLTSRIPLAQPRALRR